MISALETFHFEVTLLQLTFFSNTNSIERGMIEKKEKPGKKPLNLIRKTGEENRETTENILAP